MVFREAEAAPHMELACELNDNDPWTLLSCALYCAFCGSIERARQLAEQSLALSPAPSYLGWGYHGIIRVLCGDYAGALEACDRAHGAKISAGMARCSAVPPRSANYGEGRSSAVLEWNTLVFGWIIGPDRRSSGALGLARSSDQRKGAVGSPARRIAWRRAPC